MPATSRRVASRRLDRERCAFSHQRHGNLTQSQTSGALKASRAWTFLIGLMAGLVAADARANLGDLNGDGTADILMRHEDGRWHYHGMVGRDAIAAESGSVELTTDLDWQFAGLGDLNGDGKDDVLLRHADGRWRYHPMDGRHPIGPGQSLPGVADAPGWRLAGLGDLNGDGTDDVLLRHAVTGNWYYFPIHAGRTIVEERGMTDLTADADWRLAGLGDLDGDGKDDAVLRHVRTGRWHYAPMDGANTVDGAGSIALPPDLHWQLARLADLNGDGRDDVLLRGANGEWHYSPTLHGRERLAAGGADLPADAEWRLAGIGDLNGDGRDDVLLRHSDGGLQYRAMDGGERIAAESGATAVTSDGLWRIAGSPLAADVVASSCTNPPAVPTIAYMTTDYKLIEIASDSVVAYEDLFTVNTSVTVPVSWNKWSGTNADKVNYLLDKVAVATEAPDTTSGQAQSGAADLTVTQGGQFDLQVELCNGTCCSQSAVKEIVVADTDGSHTDPITMNDGENNTEYTNSSNSVVAAYFVEWSVYGRKFPVDKIPAYNLTHILYGFTPICGGTGINDSLKSIANSFEALQKACAGRDDYKVAIHDPWAAIHKKQAGHVNSTAYKGNFGQLMELKQRYPSLKILPSVGGWTLSDPFYSFGNATLRTRFVQSVKDFLLTWKFFDGVDIDWEYPGGYAANPNLGDPSTDGTTYLLLMQELRAMLDEVELATGRDMELTSAIAAGYEKIGRVNYTQVQQYMDYLLVMTYDFYGGWSYSVLGHMTGLYAPSWNTTDKYNAHIGIQTLVTGQSVSPSKIAVGVAMYGRGWTGVSGWKGNHHLSGTATGKVTPGTYEAGVLDYREIAANVASGNWTYHWDSTAKAPYIFKAGTGDLVSYDNADSVKAKGAYVRSKGLAGLFAWEIDGDNGDILNAMHEGLGHGTSVANRAPVASAGADFSVESAAQGTLDASASYDDDGDTLTYAWTQPSGTTVTLSSTTAAGPTFTAPTVTASTTLTFSVTVNDGTLTSAADTVTVTVLPPAANTTPVADAGADQSVKPPVTVTLDGSASSDADGDTLTYSWSQLSGTTVTLSDTTSATPTFSATAVTTSTDLRFQLTVSDGSATATDQVVVTLRPAGTNVAPTVTVPATATVAEGASLTITATASDADGDTLTYSWDTGTITATGTTTSAITFTAPAVDADQTVTMTVTVSDGTLSASASVTVTITDVPADNSAPTVSVPATATVAEGSSLTITATASDPDGDTLTYSWNTGTITATGTATSAITFTAPEVDADTTVTITVTVSDGSLTASASVAVTITNSGSGGTTNRAPVADAGADQRTVPPATVSLRGTGTDADGDTLTYSWTQTGGTTVTLTNASSATATFSASAVTAATELTFRLTVSDGALSDTDETVVTLLPDAGTSCTQVDSTAGTYPAWDRNKSHYNTGEKVNHHGLVWQAYYWTQEEPVITATDWPQQWGLVSSVEIPWHVERVYGGSKVGESTTDVNHKGRRYRASHWTKGDEPGTAAVWTDIGASTCTTTDTNSPPTVSVQSTATVAEGGSLTITATALDPDGDTLTYSWNTGTITGATGTATSAVTFTAPNVDADTTVTMTITVSDGRASASASVVVTITNDTTANSAPTVSLPATLTAAEGTTHTVTATASDADGDTLTYSWDTGTITATGTATNAITFTAPDVDTETTVTMTVTVSDGTATASASIAVKIIEATTGNAAPTVSVPATLTAAEGTSHTITATASDPDGDPLTYSWATGTITATGTATSAITFTAPEVDTDTTVTVTVTVSDGTLTASASIAVTITDVPSTNSAPTVSVPATLTAAEGTSHTITATASDPDGDTLTYSWDTGTITGATGTATSAITFTAPQVNADTTVTVTVTVSDGTLTASASIAVTITDSDGGGGTNTAPVANAGVDQRAVTPGSVSLAGSGSDADGDTLTYSWTQTGGSPSVTLTNATSATATFSAPTVTTPTDLTFRLTVNDGTSSDTDDTVVVLLQDGGTGCTQVDASAGSYAAYDPDEGPYTGGQQANHRGLVWEAYHWTDDEPIITATTWPDEWGLVSGVEFPWHAGRIYGGDKIGEVSEVNHNGRRYRAGYWTQGNEPGTHAAWTDIGASTCSHQ